jgi:hypothetical protein
VPATNHPKREKGANLLNIAPDPAPKPRSLNTDAEPKDRTSPYACQGALGVGMHPGPREKENEKKKTASGTPADLQNPTRTPHTHDA